MERGRQMRVGWSKMAIFASFACYIFRTFISKATFIILCYAAPRCMLFNDTLNGHIALKSVSGSATNGLAFPAFGQNCLKICRATHILSATKM